MTKPCKCGDAKNAHHRGKHPYCWGCFGCDGYVEALK